MTLVHSQDLDFRCSDGRCISGRLFNTAHKNDEIPLIIINNAIGASQEKYAPLADLLAKLGWQVVTYDYRGIGRSKRCLSSDKTICLHHWGHYDATAVLKWAHNNLQSNHKVMLGHSMGAQIMQFVRCPHLINAAIFIAGQKGYWRYWHNHYRYPLLFFWRIFLPSTVAVCNSFPLMKLAGCETLPKKLALDWKRWSLTHHFTDDNHQCLNSNALQLRIPLLSVSLSDDILYAPKQAVDALLTHYPSANAERWHFTPQQLQQTSIKHSGLFDIDSHTDFWKQVLEWTSKRLCNKQSISLDEGNDEHIPLRQQA